MKKPYQTPELEEICLDSKEPIATNLDVRSNAFPVPADEN